MTSLLGMILFPLMAVALSNNVRAIRGRTVLGAFALQAAVGGFVLYSEVGSQMLASLANGVSSIIAFSRNGTDFMFGNLADQGWNSLGFVFAVNVLPVIVFFAAFIAVLYHIKVMGWVIHIIGGGLQALLKTSQPESMSAAANIFVGQTEAPLVVRPFIGRMTSSELFAVMVGGLSSIAGSVMAGYAAMGIELEYLIAASFMAAPGGLMMAKIILPETGVPHDELDEVMDTDVQRHENVFDAAASGASSGLQLALNVGAMLMAFVGLLALLNAMVAWLGSLVGIDGLSIEVVLGYVFGPVAWLLGISWEEARLAGGLIGQKLVFTEFVAYLSMAQMETEFSVHARAVLVIALCGFANFASIAILLGGIGTLVPSRRPEIARLGFKALIAATLANLMSAAIAGFFLSLGIA